MRDAIIVALMIAFIGMYAAFIDARHDYLVEHRRVGVMTDMALKRERMVEAQAKMLRERPFKGTRVIYRTLP